MNFPPHPARHALCLIPLLFSVASSLPAQEAKEQTMTLRAADGRYVATTANGGLSLTGKAVGDKTVFIVADANHAELSEGDEVTIKYAPGVTPEDSRYKPTFWVEAADKIKRVNKEPKDASGRFKLREQSGSFVLETSNGKFITAAPDNELGVADTLKDGLPFKFEPTLASN